MLEGLNNVKILGESTSQVLPEFANVLMAICILSVIALVLGLIFSLAFQSTKETIVILLLGLVVGVTIYKLETHDWPYKKVYQITPLAESYQIDLTKYEIVNSKDEIITIQTIEIFNN